MSQSTLVSVADYLATSYRPDRDYVDGEVLERNLGEREHGRLQTLIAIALAQHEPEWEIVTITELRVQVAETRFRIPDVCVLRADAPYERVVSVPPLICIEILSPEDTLRRLQARIDDFLAMGVENIWVFDPEGRRVYVATKQGFIEPEGGRLVVPGTSIVLETSDLFQRLLS